VCENSAEDNNGTEGVQVNRRMEKLT